MSKLIDVPVREYCITKELRGVRLNSKGPHEIFKKKLKCNKRQPCRVNIEFLTLHYMVNKLHFLCCEESR